MLKSDRGSGMPLPLSMAKVQLISEHDNDVTRNGPHPDWQCGPPLP